MSNGFETLVTSLERRYDYQSARIIAREALAIAGLKEADKYSAADLQKFADGLTKVGSDLAAVFEVLGVTPTGAEAPAPKEADNKEEAKPAEKQQAAAKPAAKADAKAEAKADDKADAKADKKDEGAEAQKEEAKKPAAKKAPAKKK